MKKDREKLRDVFKHAANYLWRFFMQILLNSWKMLVTQTLIFPLLTLVSTTLLYIYYGLFSPDDMPKNLKAMLGILGITLGIIFVVNIIRSMFQLDRERAEEIKELKNEIQSLEGKLEFYERNPSFMFAANPNKKKKSNQDD